MNYGLSGRYKVMVVDAKTKRVLRQDRKWHNNLIMNNGMNKFASALLCNCFTYAIAGTGTTPGDKISADIGVTGTCDVAGNVVLSNSAFGLSAVTDLNNILKWTSTSYEGRITSISDTSHCVVNPLPSVGQSGNFVMYRTNYNTLVNETVRTVNYLPVSPYCSTTVIGNMLVHQRTWDFPEEVATVAYKEMGVGWSGTLNDTSDPLGGTVFARFLLHAVTTVNAGEQLRLVYQLRIVMEPYDVATKTAAITNWPVLPSTLLTGSERIQLIGMSAVSSVGATTNYDGGMYCNEPSQTSGVNIWMSTNSTALAAFGSCVDRYTAATAYANKTVTSPTYANYAYTKLKVCTMTIGDCNSTAIRTMGLGYNGGSGNAGKFNTVCFLFDQNQTKTITNQLDLQYFHTWSRVLSPSSV